MKAIRYHSYGSPDVLRLADVDMPPVNENDVLVRVRAAAVNPLDWHYLRGLPYAVRGQVGLRRPKAHGLGGELAGVVEAVGSAVTTFKPGDEVFGGRGDRLDERAAAFAEYASVPDSWLVAKPGGWTFEQAAATPVAGVSALQALRDKANVQKGQKVLVNGAAGGTGTFTVQLAKAFGAEVTGVCGTGNVDLVRSLGADEVIDYTTEDFTRSGKRYDVVIDNAASRSLADIARVLAPKGVHVGVGLASTGRWLGPVIRPLAMVVRNLFVGQRITPILAHNSKDDLAALAALAEEGKLTPAIDRKYSLTEVPDAIRYVETGHAKAKVVITV
ncbi:NAD(P)-dependent alcohol dehydrogenase [Actinophytocola sp.]|uniref:NAD(P)-dependent alcohol dehydrogenase n=1 Tax=Actinophytocola sp. TaxID=1872138 RepID=UPI002ED2A8E6